MPFSAIKERGCLMNYFTERPWKGHHLIWVCVQRPDEWIPLLMFILFIDFFCVRIYLGFPLRFIYSVIAQFLNTGSFLKILNIFNCFLIRFLLMQPNHYKDRRKKIFSSLFWIGCLFIFISYARYLSLSAFFCYFMHQWDLAIVFFIPRTNQWNDYKIGDK